MNAAIVDLGLGNLFSVKNACTHVGMKASITRDAGDLVRADCVFLPGVGAFADAMDCLDRNGLVPVLRDLAGSKPLIGICLGMQLLMTKSEEFGDNEGLDIIPGRSVFFPQTDSEGDLLRVPHVGWNSISPVPGGEDTTGWSDTELATLEAGTPMYFAHSLYVIPDDATTVLTETDYGGIRFCSGVRLDGVLGFQFHPERSGPAGLSVYRSIARFTAKNRTAAREGES